MRAVKRIIGIALVSALVIGPPWTGESLANMKNSKHDLRGSNSNAELCLPCHTPHDGDDTVGYLWNHAYQPGTAFTTWEGATLGDESLMCLGCHDGQTVRDNYTGGDNSGGWILTGRSSVGMKLTDDHPVGIEYPDSSRYAEKTIIYEDQEGIDAGSGKYLPLYENATTGKVQVECATCHAVHNTSKDYLLRFVNDGSAMCIACHATW
ncbi:MAG: hypothetical protein HQ592_06395 [Planctomycetes bacterium]|nr:hypothetical protein [Planctomycetota bacterium]